MADMMAFPNTVEEFMEKYKITDTERVYTNGAELVPIFRMKQWFDHESEREKGKWIYKPNEYDDGTFECSACGEPWTLIEGNPKDNNMNFCPNRGADMGGEHNETD